MRCVSTSWADTTGHCEVEIPVTQCCMRDVVGIGDRVPDKSGECGK